MLKSEHNISLMWEDSRQQGQRSYVLQYIFSFSLARSGSAHARKKQHRLLSFAFPVFTPTGSCAIRHRLHIPSGTVVLQNRITHKCVGPVLLSDTSLWRLQHTQHSSVGLNTRKLISSPNLPATTGFSSITWLASAQVLSGVSQVQLSGYPFFYDVIIIIISFPNQLIVFCSFSVHLLLNHLLFLPSFLGGENSPRCCSTRIYRTRNKLFLESAVYLFYFLHC